MLRDLIKSKQGELTASELKLVATFVDDGFVSGLQSITKLADDSGVSTATVIRLVRKLGFGGFPEFQDAVRAEISETMKQPLAKLPAGSEGQDSVHILNRFAKAVGNNINVTLMNTDSDTFDAIAALISDLERPVYLFGGRITRSNAHYFFNHLQIIRPNVHLLDASPSVWPQSLLDMDEYSTLIVFDIRRYEKEIERLAGLAKTQGAQIVLFTDQWGSPIEAQADYVLHAMVEAPSSWDSTLALNFLIEALIADVQSRSAQSSRERIATMEEMLGEARIFRSF